MSKVLIVYPHGLGDCILATPALREYKRQTDNFVGFATLERFRSAELFRHNPYVDEIFYTKDAWNDYPDFDTGTRAVKQYCESYAKDNKYDKVIMIQHSSTNSKILDCFDALELWRDDNEYHTVDYHTEVYLTPEDHEWADRIVRSREPFGFIHSETGVPYKNLPEGYGRNWLLKKKGSMPMYEAFMEEPIGRGFALLKQATNVAVTDSVYYHAAGALDKDVDLAFFARGPQVYERVRPLHAVNQNIVYQLERL